MRFNYTPDDDDRIPRPYFFPRNEREAAENLVYSRWHKNLARRGRLLAIERRIKEDNLKAKLGTAMITDTPFLQIAQIAANLAAVDIGIPDQRVIELGAEHIRRNSLILGFSHSGQDNRIEIRTVGVCAFEVALTAAHETWHREQYLSGRFLDLLGKGQSELEAEKFETLFAAEFLTGFACNCAGGPFRKPRGKV